MLCHHLHVGAGSLIIYPLPLSIKRPVTAHVASGDVNGTQSFVHLFTCPISTELPACRKELVGVSIQKLKSVSDVSSENTPEEDLSSHVPLSIPFLLLVFLSGVPSLYSITYVHSKSFPSLNLSTLQSFLEAPDIHSDVCFSSSPYVFQDRQTNN